MRTQGGVESKIGVWGDLYTGSTGAGGTEGNRERMGVVSYPADQLPTMGWDAGAHTRMPPCPLHDSLRRHHQASCHHHLSITP